jgi:Outer membrane protein beta-barrel domain
VKSASVLGCVFAGCGLWLAAPSARAQENPLGLYVGAGVGNGSVRQEPTPDTGGYGLVRDDIGWDAFIGVRPIPFLGAEIGYTDFGSVDRRTYYFDPVSATYTSQVFGHVSAHSPTAFAVGYLPLPMPFDVYGKLGAARLYKAWDFAPGPVCSPGTACPPGAIASFGGSATEWDFAWGIGTQWKAGPMALRVEYERVNTNGNANAGDPDLLSVGVSWTFF